MITLVNPEAISRLVEVKASLDTVEVRLSGIVVARHDRYWAKGHTFSKPEHVSTAARMDQEIFNSSNRSVSGDDFDLDLSTRSRIFNIEESQ